MLIYNSVEYHPRGVGCIFVEMHNGQPCFPGVRDIYDQLDKVSECD